MKFRKYCVQYSTKTGSHEMMIDADSPASASDACYYEHCDEEEYTEIRVIESEV